MTLPSPNAKQPQAEAPPDYQDLYHRLIANHPSLIYRLTLWPAKSLFLLNDQALALTGYDQDKLMAGQGDGIFSLILPEDQEQVTTGLAAAMAGHQHFAVSYRLRHRDGSLRYLSDRGIVIYTPNGRPVALEGVIIDRTEQELAEQATRAELLESSILYDQIISCAEEGVIVYGPDLHYRVWNPFMETISGKTAPEVLGKHPLDVFPFLGQFGMVERLERALQGEHLPPIEFPNLSGAGKAGWTADHTAPLRNHAGKIIGVIGIVQDITEQKQAEIALQQSEKMLQAIIDAEPECVKLLDAECRLLMMNRAGLAMLDVDSFAEVQGQCVCPLIASDHWPHFQELTNRVFQGESGILVFEIVSTKGRHLWLETHAVPFRNEKNEIIALLGVTRDITASREAEAALRQNRERFRTLYNETPILLHSIDRSGTIVDVNNHWLKTLGYERREVVGRQATDFYTLDSKKYALEVVQPTFFRDGVITDISLQFVKKNGQVVDVLLSASGERDSEGKVIRSQAVIKDVTEQKKAAEALRKSEKLVRGILDNVDEGFIVLNRELRIQAANNSFCRQTGIPAAAAIGRHCHEISHGYQTPCDEHGEKCVVKQVFATGTSCVAFHVHKNPDGTARYVETRGYPLPDESGAITSAIEVIHDVTASHLLEAEQLKSQKLEAIGTLAGGIAHDFNNLLQGVFGYLSLAKSLLAPDTQPYAALEQAEQALTLSTHLTRQLLTFAKGGQPVKNTLTLPTLIRNASNFALSGSACRAHLHLAEGLWAVEADAGQIGQVIQNIVLNAAQAMPGGGGIDISAANLPLTIPNPTLNLEQGNYVTITIRDHGPGISPNNLTKIFDPYFTTKAGGSGLGLATSYSIIKNHGGRIRVESNPEQGTTFTIHLPATTAPIKTEKPRPALPSSSPSKRGKILIMDDDQTILNLAGVILPSLGHEVEVAKNGEEAIEKYQAAINSAHPFDLVILDLTIQGGLGGIETMQQLQALDPAVKAVVSSGYSADSTLAQYKAHGFQFCLNKPYTLQELRETLNTLL